MSARAKKTEEPAAVVEETTKTPATTEDATPASTDETTPVTETEDTVTEPAVEQVEEEIVEAGDEWTPRFTNGTPIGDFSTDALNREYVAGNISDVVAKRLGIL